MRRWVRCTVGVGALLAVGLSVGLAGDARASTSLAATWEGLLHESSTVAVVTALETRGVWEDGRIYTYTRVHVDRAVEGDLGTGQETWVRTMGGVVRNTGQRVEGEASFDLGVPSLVFAHPGPAGAYVVTARGQGQFPLLSSGSEKDARPRVVRGPSLGLLIAPRPPGTGAAPRLAAEVVADRFLDDVARDISADWPRLHVPRP
jgi:hypothetical protein